MSGGWGFVLRGCALAAGVAVVLAGCSQEADLGLPPAPSGGLRAPASSAPAATPVESVAPSVGATVGPAENVIKVGALAPGTAPQTAVQAAYLRFWSVRARAVQAAAVDEAALGQVAEGQAADGVRQSVQGLAAKKQHALGGSTLNVRAVTVKGTAATLTDCLQDLSVAADARGKPQELPDLTPSPLAVTLHRSGGVWRVAALQRGQDSICARTT